MYAKNHICVNTLAMKCLKAADRCMQIHGGMGLTKDMPIEQFFRDQRSMVITEGPTEILKMALARLILREYGA